jgi:hypothetical protein
MAIMTIMPVLSFGPLFEGAAEAEAEAEDDAEAEGITGTTVEVVPFEHWPKSTWQPLVKRQWSLSKPQNL